MTEHLNLSAADFVSRRETSRLMQKGDLLRKQNEVLLHVLDEVAETFARGRKLDSGGLAQMVGRLRSAVEESEPLKVVENTYPGSRARPGSEMHEILVLSRCPADDDHPHITALAARRFSITRKRLVIDTPSPFTEINRHVYERAVQRQVARWDGGLADIEKALVEACGLMVVWCHALLTGRVTSPFVACPAGDGLLLGEFSKTDLAISMTHRVIAGRDAVSYVEVEPPSVLTAMEDGQPRALRCVYSTAINDDLMRPGQISLRDELSLYMVRYGAALAEIASLSHWPHSRAAEAMPAQAVNDALDRLADELAQVAGDEYHLDALKGPSSRVQMVPQPLLFPEDREPQTALHMAR
jgi:hypothetical protein